ncbi:MAG: hypothetical protein R2795_14095 [Saprospiraceae bacterium]
MSVKDLKLQLIQQISRCDDLALLQTIASMMHDLNHAPTNAPVHKINHPLHPLSPPTSHPNDEAVNELQAEIDAVFGNS